MCEARDPNFSYRRGEAEPVDTNDTERERAKHESSNGRAFHTPVDSGAINPTFSFASRGAKVVIACTVRNGSRKSLNSKRLLLQLRVLEEPHRFVLEVSEQLELVSEMRI